ncbi:curli-like amyloid fiber formation chaperone CsgH [Methylorubrum sp. GM97]|uniref:curli-like amyloid fiber formation chaperone CsgH n=1 Tax=Methylorubrum sp. GM97 TaxID=2938232 RepID=UPI0021C4B0B2|nr:curli-like amyloid fiber formation chaperone CsgH [Methylorubrum sp. GM97]
MPDTSLTQTNPAPAHVQPAPSPSAPLRCELHQARRGGEQVLVAVVHSAIAAEGEYEFSIAARDAGRNSVSSSTGDAFQIRAGQRAELEGPSLSLGRGAKLQGRLELRDPAGRTLTQCSL